MKNRPFGWFHAATSRNWSLGRAARMQGQSSSTSAPWTWPHWPVSCVSWTYLPQWVNLLDLFPLPLLIPLPPFQHDVAADGMFNPFRENGLSTVYVYYDDVSKDHVQTEIKAIVERFRGMVGVLLVDVWVNANGVNRQGFPTQCMLPAPILLQETEAAVRLWLSTRVEGSSAGSTTTWLRHHSTDACLYEPCWFRGFRAQPDDPQAVWQ